MINQSDRNRIVLDVAKEYTWLCTKKRQAKQDNIVASAIIQFGLKL